jgi:hypothetical protein
MNLAGRTFRAVANSKNGSLNANTEMHFTNDEGIVVARYSGGTIVAGHVLGKRVGESELELLYQGATTSGEVQAGKAHARFEQDSEGRTRMHLDWQWLTGDQSKGQSEWVLV